LNRQHNDQKKKGQKEKQRSRKPTHKTKDRVTRIPLKTGGDIRMSYFIDFAHVSLHIDWCTRGVVK